MAVPFMDRLKNPWILLAYAGLLTAFVMSIVGLTGPYLPASEVCPSGSTLQYLTVSDFVEGQCAALEDGKCDDADIKQALEAITTGDIKANTVLASFCARHDDEYTVTDLGNDYKPTGIGLELGVVKLFAENRAKSHQKEDETPTIEDMCSAATKDSPKCTSFVIPKDTVVIQDKCTGCKTGEPITSDTTEYQYKYQGPDKMPYGFSSVTQFEDFPLINLCDAASKEFTCCLVVPDTDAGTFHPMCKASSDATGNECMSNTYDKATNSIECAYTVEKNTEINVCTNSDVPAIQYFENDLNYEDGEVVLTEGTKKEAFLERYGLPSNLDVNVYVCADTQVRGLNCTEDAINGIDYCYEDIDGFDFMVSAVIVAIVFIVINFIAIMRQGGNDDKDMGVVISFFIVSIIFIGVAFGLIYSSAIQTNPQARQTGALGLTLTATILTGFNIPLAALIRSAMPGDFSGSHMVLSNARF